MKRIELNIKEFLWNPNIYTIQYFYYTIALYTIIVFSYFLSL